MKGGDTMDRQFMKHITKQEIKGHHRDISEQKEETCIFWLCSSIF